MRPANVHWIPTTKSIKSYCGRMLSLVTTHKKKVTCRSCIRLMKIHGHRADAEEAQE